MSCLPSDWSVREHRLMRALYHLMHKNHPLKPSTCAGCQEVAGFVIMTGYQGDTDYPTCPELGAVTAAQREEHHA